MNKKLLITNLVYGKVYSEIFLEQHLKSLLDPSNIPAFKDRIEYIIFTDTATLPTIKEHPNYKLLSELIPTDVVEMMQASFDERYSGLVTMFKESVKIALKEEQFLSCLVADLVFAKGYIGKVFSKLDYGYDSVFVLPLRSAAEAVIPILDKKEGALDDVELCYLGYDNLHPLWVACHWNAAQFTKLPFSLLWNTGTGLLAHSFSITPIAFTPNDDMLRVSGVIDVEVPHLCKNPFWATDWVDCPVIGVEPLACYYPPWGNHRANAELIGKSWCKCLHPSQFKYLEKPLYYPAKNFVNPQLSDIVQADYVVKEINKWTPNIQPLAKSIKPDSALAEQSIEH